MRLKKWIIVLSIGIVILILISALGLEEKTEPVKEKQKQSAWLWGEVEGKILVPLITVWKYSPCQKPWPAPKYAGEWILTTAPHKTEIAVLERTEKQGKTCYKIEVPEGKIIGWVSSSLVKLK